MKHLFTTGVWGEEYVDRFLKYALPCQMAEGNLDGLPGLENSRYQIITKKPDADRMKASPAIRLLQDWMEVEFLFIEDIIPDDFKGDKYSYMSMLQKEAMRRLDGFDTVTFGYADILWAKGSLQNAAKRLEEGYDAVLAPGLPVLESKYRKELDAKKSVWSEVDGVSRLTMEPRQFVDLTLNNLHSLATTNYWSCKHLSWAPAYFIWDVPGHGIIMRWFHLHPVMMRTVVDDMDIFREFEGSLDADFVPALFPSSENIYFATDSDELCFCSIMEDFQVEEGVQPLCVPMVAQWAENHAVLLHREFFNNAFYFHSTELDDKLWESATKKSDWVAKEVEKRLLVPDSTLALMDPGAFAGRRERQKRYGLWLRQLVGGNTINERRDLALLSDDTKETKPKIFQPTPTSLDPSASFLLYLMVQKLWQRLNRSVSRFPLIGRLFRSLAVRALIKWIKQKLGK